MTALFPLPELPPAEPAIEYRDVWSNPMPTGYAMKDAPGERWVKVTELRVYGFPKGQPRPRAFARRMGNKFVARVYDAGTAEAWKNDIAAAAGKEFDVLLDCPLRVCITFLFPRPQCLCRKKDPPGRIVHTAKPDIDNLAKAVLDCLVRIGFLRDDSLVCQQFAEKYFVCKENERPGAHIEVFKLEGGE